MRNEQYLPKLYDDLEHATKSITISQFNWEPDGSGRRVIDILKRKASEEGLDVRVMVDAWGFRERGMKAALELQDELEAAGVKVQRSWPFLPRQGWEHRKLITIDDMIAYMGGLGFGEKYDTWTDLMARVEGPAGAVAGAHGLTTWRDLAGALDAKAAARLARIGIVLDQSAQARRAGMDTGAAVTLLENQAEGQPANGTQPGSQPWRPASQAAAARIATTTIQMMAIARCLCGYGSQCSSFQRRPATSTRSSARAATRHWLATIARPRNTITKLGPGTQKVSAPAIASVMPDTSTAMRTT